MSIHFHSESLYVFSIDVFNQAIHLDQYIHNYQVYLKEYSKIYMLFQTRRLLIQQI